MLCFYAVWELLLLLRSLHDGLRKRAQQLKNGTYNREIQAAVCVSYIDQDFTGFLGLLERWSPLRFGDVALTIWPNGAVIFFHCKRNKKIGLVFVLSPVNRFEGS